MKLTPRSFIEGSIIAHEGGYSKHLSDNGNWFDPVRYAKGLPQTAGMGQLVGSTFGVTAYAYCKMYGKKTVTAEDMQAITRDQAVDIGIALYFNAPGFNKLVWNRVTASIFDKAWGSGPGQATKLMQRMIGVKDDGIIGPATAAAYKAYIDRVGEANAAIEWAKIRIAFDTSLKQPTFLQGWNNRTNSFKPGTKWWNDAA